MKRILLLASLVSIVSCSTNDEDYFDNTANTEEKSLNVLGNSIADPAKEGSFIKMIDYQGGEHYIWIFRGKMRHITSLLTWNGLWNKDKRKFSSTYNTDWGSIHFFTQRPLGTPLSENNGLRESIEDGRVFFIENNTLSYITSPDVFNNVYKFNRNAIQKVSYIRNVYVLSSDGVLIEKYKMSDGKTYNKGANL